MNWNSFHLFLKVSEKKSITLAAEDLHLTVSAVSQALKKLQDDLGVDLVTKNGRGIELTPEGHFFYEKLKIQHQELENTIQSISQQSEALQLSGVLRLGLYTGFPTEHLVPLMADLQKNHDLKFKIVIGSGKKLIGLLEKGELDLAICLSFMGGKQIYSPELLYKEELILVSSTKPPKRSLNLNELLEAPFVDYFEGQTLMERWAQFHFNKKIKNINVRTYVPTAKLVLECILNGVGIGVVPYSLARPYIKSGQLFVIKAKGEQLSISTSLYRSPGANRIISTLFSDYIKSNLDLKKL